MPRRHGTASARTGRGATVHNKNSGKSLSQLFFRRVGASSSGVRLAPALVGATSIRTAALVVAVGLAGARPCVAQQDGAQPARPEQKFETRAELEAQAKAAEAQHRQGEAFLLRQRLQRGDFQDGDRIIFKVQGNALMDKSLLQLPETLIVREGKRIELPRMADLSLDGVLRSELNDRLTQHIAMYVKEPNIRSTPLVRIAVLGYVGRPGYVYTLADAPLSDVIMQAGGPGGDADMDKIEIKRGPDVIWDTQDTRAALADGMSLDRLHIRAGDEIFVPQQRHFPWLAAFSVGVSTMALLFTFFRR